jgi:hypothetical protein
MQPQKPLQELDIGAGIRSRDAQIQDVKMTAV